MMGYLGFARRSDDQLEEVFDDMDSDMNGCLDKTEIAEALRKLGHAEHNIQRLVDSMTQEELSLNDFKALVRTGRSYTVTVGGIPVPNPFKVHDLPIIGSVTSLTESMVSSIAGPVIKTAFGGFSEQQLEQKFKDADANCVGKMNAKQVATALRSLKVREADIRTAIQRIGDTEVDIDGFKHVVREIAEAPSLSKTHDIPIIGHITSLSEYLVSSAAGAVFGMAFTGFSDEQLEQQFKEIDTDCSGALDGKEIAAALRSLQMKETDIKYTIRHMGDNGLDIEGFKQVVRGASESPSFGSVMSSLGVVSMTAEELKRAFDYMDTSRNGSLDKSEVAEALRRLGHAEHSVQRMVESMTQEELRLDDFMKLARSGRSYTVNVGGIPMPNPFKVHDVPVVGSITSLTESLVSSVTSPVLKMAFRGISKEQLEQKFIDVDTDCRGKINVKQVAVALRALSMKESDIRTAVDKVDSMGECELDIDSFSRLVNGLAAGRNTEDSSTFGGSQEAVREDPFLLECYDADSKSYAGAVETCSSEPIPSELCEGNQCSTTSCAVSFCSHSKPSLLRTAQIEKVILRRPDNQECSLLTQEIAEYLCDWLPVGLRLPGAVEWVLRYTPKVHGLSFATMLRNMEEHEKSVVVIRDTEDHVFGGFAPAAWKPFTRFYGSGEAFVFSLGPLQPELSEAGIHVCPWTSQNECLMYVDHKNLGMGGGDGRHAFVIREDLLNGHSSATATFNNKILSATAEFVVRDLELWSIDEVA
eukprot:TRINITY_DN44856_c0_g1_i1.p1 TRINITY_DN44856_c0_g1~~TRINITY_DN44856_c0_g1_i1.p1  ORF type:complete len:757 (+),score=110.31 TRINITY_DN44856_c0_g1_i1:140-2410(+)